MEMVPLAANRFLEMMSETAIGALLLEQAALAEKALATLPEDHVDRPFYTGKRYASLFYAVNTLATVPGKATLISKEDKTPVEIPTDAFATV
jgi:hypothetical protein